MTSGKRSSGRRGSRRRRSPGKRKSNTCSLPLSARCRRGRRRPGKRASPRAASARKTTSAYRGSERCRFQLTWAMRSSQSAMWNKRFVFDEKRSEVFPIWRAISTGVRPSGVARFMSAPRSSSSRARLMPEPAAACSGVIVVCSGVSYTGVVCGGSVVCSDTSAVRSTAAPRSRQSRAVSTCPLRHAIHSGVAPPGKYPRSLARSTSAPRSRHRVATSTFPFRHASQSAVALANPCCTRLTSAPRSRSSFAVSTCPSWHAIISAVVRTAPPGSKSATPSCVSRSTSAPRSRSKRTAST
mmetsp:Transcript_6170/g.19012  ORF Transcript_6170/g.19012 Transcript_6170/m.19012 type:complete len:298 (-) Transcript_6170:277-1170(-)